MLWLGPSRPTPDPHFPRLLRTKSEVSRIDAKAFAFAATLGDFGVRAAAAMLGQSFACPRGPSQLLG